MQCVYCLTLLEKMQDFFAWSLYSGLCNAFIPQLPIRAYAVAFILQSHLSILILIFCQVTNANLIFTWGKFFGYTVTCQFELLIEVCWILASEAQFLGHVGPQIDHKSNHFLKYFPLVAHHSCFTCLFGILCVLQCCAQKDLFWGLKFKWQWNLLGLSLNTYQHMWMEWQMLFSYHHSLTHSLTHSINQSNQSIDQSISYFPGRVLLNLHMLTYIMKFARPQANQRYQSGHHTNHPCLKK